MKNIILGRICQIRPKTCEINYIKNKLLCFDIGRYSIFDLEILLSIILSGPFRGNFTKYGANSGIYKFEIMNQIVTIIRIWITFTEQYIISGPLRGNLS